MLTSRTRQSSLLFLPHLQLSHFSRLPIVSLRASACAYIRNMVTSTPNVTDPSDIPTLADLYSSRELAKYDDIDFKHNDSLNKRVSIWRGDITKLNADMIVNAANKSLLGGGGVDGAIHRAAGRDLLTECETLGGADTGETKVTKGYHLPSTLIAHTVGPVYSSRNVERSEAALTSCYRTSLEHCKNNGGGVIGFSSISTGVYGYPMADATEVALHTVRQFLESEDSVNRVIFVVFSAKDEKVYREIAPEFFPPPDDYEPARGPDEAQSGGKVEEEKKD